MRAVYRRLHRKLQLLKGTFAKEAVSQSALQKSVIIDAQSISRGFELSYRSVEDDAMIMRKQLRDAYIRLIGYAPQLFYPSIRALMKKRHGVRFAAQCDLEHFRTIRKRGLPNRLQRVKVIEKGLHNYEFFNVCFLNDMLSDCLRAICDGYIPRIQILRTNGENVWEDFFEQPVSTVTTDGKPAVIQQDNEKDAIPRWRDIFDPNKVFLYGNLYNAIPIFKAEVLQYISREISGLLTGRKVLGVLCRGTDYTMTRPAGHPIQPDADEILNKAQEIYRTGGYDYLYLATEDSAYETLFRAHFGDRLLINKRQYYDCAFTDHNLHRIIDVHFQRENDDYYKGLEYLSSLMILSKCQGLVAGNCGGTQAAVFWNRGQYEDMYVFDLGLYEQEQERER